MSKEVKTKTCRHFKIDIAIPVDSFMGKSYYEGSCACGKKMAGFGLFNWSGLWRGELGKKVKYTSLERKERYEAMCIAIEKKYSK